MSSRSHSRGQFAEVVRREPLDLAVACHLLALEADAEASAGTAAGAAAAPRAETGAAAAPEAAAEPGAAANDVAAGLVDPSSTLTALDRLAARARPLFTARATPARPFPRVDHGRPVGAGSAGGFGWLEPRIAAEALHEALGLDAGFAGSADDYDDLRSSLLPDVLRRRRGLPILLSVVWLEVAHRLGIAAYPVGLPGHVVVAVGSPQDFVLVDPFDAGRLLTIHDAAAKVRAAGTAFSRSHLAPMDPADVLTRILGNIRVLAARTDAPRTRLWAVELSLLLPHHPASLRRERGELRIRLGDFLGGARDLTSFADTVAEVEPTAAAAARQAAVTARARLN
ncbi:transglutaminase-like domain-containing protein [Frankia sp. Ag45/Mut15]|uniref:Transglutaminase-like domain-containing protein n=1 Tax=Frankia umida TaxID=573489 RepID=A0ABT0JVU4_9ACTN|nr:transglutaminase-like domain-containing protein [Frankia umida]MCK9875671.1 transglutaminase-like domain-containing protein [Frankia umida]